MKKMLNFSLAMMAAASLSCSREAAEPVMQQEVMTGVVGTDKVRPPVPVIYPVFKWGFSGYECSGSGGSCLPPVVVHPDNVSFKSIFEIIGTDNQSAIQNGFRMQKAELKNYFAEEVLDKAISGVYIVTAKSNTITFTKFMTFSSAENNVIQMVYPIVEK